MSAPIRYQVGDAVVLAGADGRHFVGVVSEVTGEGERYFVRTYDAGTWVSAAEASELMRPMITRAVAEQSLAALRDAPPTTLEGLAELLERAATSLSHEARRDALRHIYGLTTIDDRGLADSQLLLEHVVLNELSQVLDLNGNELLAEMRARHPAQDAFRARFASQFRKEPAIPITRFDPK